MPIQIQPLTRFEIMTIQCTIVETTPQSEYDGRVYDQIVTVQLEDGQEIGLFDPNVQVTDELSGLTVTAELGFLLRDCTVLESTATLGIDSAGRDTANGHRYTGSVRQISRQQDSCDVELTLPDGSLLFTAQSDTLTGVQRGDIVSMDAQRSDLVSIPEH